MEFKEFEVSNKKIGEEITKFLLDYDKSAELIERFVECRLEYRNIKPENIDLVICYLKKYKGSTIQKIMNNGVSITTTDTLSDACIYDENISKILNAIGDNGLGRRGGSLYKYYIKTKAVEALRWYLTFNSKNYQPHEIMFKFEQLDKKPLTLAEYALEYYEQNDRGRGGSTRKHKYHHIQNRRKPRHRHKSRTNKRRRTTRGRK